MRTPRRAGLHHLDAAHLGRYHACLVHHKTSAPSSSGPDQSGEGALARHRRRLGSLSPPGDDDPGYLIERGIQAVLPHPRSELGIDLAMVAVEATPMLTNVERVLIAVLLAENKILEPARGSVGVVQKDVSVLIVR